MPSFSEHGHWSSFRAASLRAVASLPRSPRRMLVLPKSHSPARSSAHTDSSAPSLPRRFVHSLSRSVSSGQVSMRRSVSAMINGAQTHMARSRSVASASSVASAPTGTVLLWQKKHIGWWRRRKRERRAIVDLRQAQKRYASLTQMEEETSRLRPALKNSVRFREENALLDSLEHACRLLEMEEADRSYRNDFTPNYRALFPGGKRRWLYRVDILHAAQDAIDAIWVNGERYTFPAEVLEAGAQLSKNWQSLMQWLTQAVNRVNTHEFMQLMTTVDQSWVQFEELYVKKLIFIEGRAKRMLVEAVHLEEKMSASSDSEPETRRQLVEAINRLNSLGNVEGKGRSDLAVEILEFTEGDGNCYYPELHCLSADIRRTFKDLCAYFRSISHCIDLVEPHLANNTELVRLLGAWEESWEIGKKYMIDENLRMGLVSFIRHVKAVCFLDGMESFEDKLRIFDVDALWDLSKIALLQFLTSPHSNLLCREFLPECWIDDGSLETLAQIYAQLPDDAYHHLYMCAIGCATPTKPMEEFWAGVEKLATHVQRRHPTDWNRFAMVFMRCFIADANNAVEPDNTSAEDLPDQEGTTPTCA